MAQSNLFVCSNSPFSAESGGQQRTKLVFEYLLSLGHVHLICITWDTFPEQVLPPNVTIHFWGIKEDLSIPKWRRSLELLNIFNPYIEYNKNIHYHTLTRRVLSKVNPDNVVVRYVYPLLSCGLLNQPNLIVDVDDLPIEAFGLKARFAKSQGEKFMAMYRMFHYTWHFHRNRNKFKHVFYNRPEHLGATNSSFLPNIPFNIPINALAKNFERNDQNIAFVAALDYMPNQAGIEWFLSNVWPHILQKIPTARLSIYGKLSQEKIRKKWGDHKGVRVHGYVDDISEVYKDNNVIIAPIFHGSGTNIKVLEAMAFAKPCVISSFAARGLQSFLSHGENVMITDQPELFSKFIMQILKDQVLAENLGRKGRETILQHFSKEEFIHRLSRPFIDA